MLMMKAIICSTLFTSLTMFSAFAQAQMWAIGHRADELEFTQNSMEAFLGAAKLGATLAEHDLRITKDHIVIVHHDPNLNDNEECGAFNGKAISDITFAELETCRFKKEHTAIPTFEEVLQKMKTTQTGLLIELKDGVQKDVIRMLSELDPHRDCATPHPSQEVLNKTYQCFSKTIIYSFVEGWVEDTPALLKQHPELHRVRLLKLVPPTQNRNLLLSANAHYWNVDGVALEVNSMGADAEVLLAKIQAQYPHQIILIWSDNRSDNGKMDFSRLTKLPVTGIIASDIRGLINYLKSQKSSPSENAKKLIFPINLATALLNFTTKSLRRLSFDF